MKKVIKNPVLLAIAAAVCYGIGSPVSKLLLTELPPVFIAALLYMGAGIGMTILHIAGKGKASAKEARLTKSELPYIIGMIILDIAAPIALVWGLSLSTPANTALLNNFEIVTTSLIALIVFKEAVGRRMWLSIVLITLSGLMLSFEDFSSLSFSFGSLLVLAACVCWGFENNCTRMLSLKDPLQIVIIKGIGSGFGSLVIAIALKEYVYSAKYILIALQLGFLAYGMSVYLYILAQREMGAARTSAYYAIAPFIGVGLSFIFYKQPLTPIFITAFCIMAAGAYFAAAESHGHKHTHTEIEHEHRHSHTDGHHTHFHDYAEKEHSHMHKHECVVHDHAHKPDMHHSHTH